MKDKNDLNKWWENSIIDMKPGEIKFRGQHIQDLIGNLSFSQMIWLMLRGETPSKEQSELLEAALVAGVDHGPQAPSIAAARMAATCGLSLNNVIATGVNMLGDVHGGAGEQCAELYYSIDNMMKDGENLDKSLTISISKWREKYGKIISGFGHRFHKPTDPRAPRLMELVEFYANKKIISGNFKEIGLAVQNFISSELGKPIAMNIDGATAVIFCELGFDAMLSRGLFCISRSIGILAHGYEQKLQGGRNKGPMPPDYLPNYKSKE